MNKKYLIGGIVLIVLILGFFVVQQNFTSPSTSSERSTSNQLSPVSSITHGHGMAVDVNDPTKIYIATHHGLLVLVNEKDLFQVGNKKDDYMGFSPHPRDSKIFFSSGHPSTGGNIGFQKSEDGGFSWKKISNGINGPVDFHAMTVSPANPSLIYGWFQGALQRSTDEGKNWEIASNTDFPVVNLTADPKDENIVYAATPQGLLASNNKGQEFSKILDGFVSVVAINPQDSQKLISYSESQQLAKSSDGGKTWEKVNTNLAGETPLFISFNKQDSNVTYLLTEKNSIYKSTNGAITWVKIR
jgi:photosystem II stability/assembly factor-like uncharacterized protein